MTTKAATGPWYAVNNAAVRNVEVDGFPTTAVAVSSHGCARAIALVYAGFGDGPETARLIAAAPKTLEALKGAAEMLNHIRRGGSYAADEYITRLSSYHQAIAEAEAA